MDRFIRPTLARDDDWKENRDLLYKFPHGRGNSAHTVPTIGSKCATLFGLWPSVLSLFFFLLIFVPRNPYRDFQYAFPTSLSPVSGTLVSTRSQTALLPRPIDSDGGQSIKFEGWHFKIVALRFYDLTWFLSFCFLSLLFLRSRTAAVSARIRWTAWYPPAIVRSARIRETCRRTPRVRPCSARWNRVSARNVVSPAAKNGS